MKKLILLLTVLILSLISTKVSFSTEEVQNYTCDVVWIVGAYRGKGKSIAEAVNDARRLCEFDKRRGGGRACSGVPQDIECKDNSGQCITSLEFLKMGLSGGKSCNQ